MQASVQNANEMGRESEGRAGMTLRLPFEEANAPATLPSITPFRTILLRRQNESANHCEICHEALRLESITEHMSQTHPGCSANLYNCECGGFLGLGALRQEKKKINMNL